MNAQVRLTASAPRPVAESGIGAGTDRSFTVIDSTLANPRQKDSNNRVGNVTVMQRADRRSVGWLCRRGGMRFPACWAAGDVRQAYGGIGCWRADRRAVCGRTERAAQSARLSA